MEFTCPFILASKSPRRKHLLQMLHLNFAVMESTEEEVILPAQSPSKVVLSLSTQKARNVSARVEEGIILAADTIVVLENQILGKPQSADEAISMLALLSGRDHEVYTGITLLHMPSGRLVADYEKTTVAFATLTNREITKYVETGSPLDKAGAYGIQDDYGAFFVSKIVGDYYNVVGLPLQKLYQLLKLNFNDFLKDV